MSVTTLFLTDLSLRGFQIFSNFLREVYDTDDQLLFLYARHLMIQQLGLNLSSKHKLKDTQISRVYLNKGSVTTQSHPLLTDGVPACI